jgi:hypothetical protein
MQRPQRLDVQPVAFVNAVGDVRGHVRAQRPKRLDEQRSAGHAVGVEVPVDHNRLAALDRLADAPYRLRHAGQREGVVRQPVAVEKGAGLVGRVLPAIVEHLGDHGVIRV